MVVWSLGDYRRARQLLNDTLTRSRAVLGDDHWATLLSAIHLGMVLWSLGDYQQARQLQTDTLTRLRRVLGEDHFLTLRSASRLGLTLCSLGKLPAGPTASKRRPDPQPPRPRRGPPRHTGSASLLALTLGALGEHQQARSSSTTP